MVTRVGIALGSNLPSQQGNRLSNIKAARDSLIGLMPPAEIILQAPIYQSEPLNCPDGSPVFLNTVVEIAYDSSPLDLLKNTQAIERKLGRDTSHQRNSPRIIDIDILYFGSESHHQSGLIIPHPEITHRLFVLQPLSDIRPRLLLPGNDNTIADCLQHLDSDEPPLTLVEADW